MADVTPAEGGFKYQLSVKLPVGGLDNYRDDMLNIRANTPEEFMELLNAFLEPKAENLVDALAAVEVMVKATAIAAVGLGVDMPNPVDNVTVTTEAISGGAQDVVQGVESDPVPENFRPAFEGKQRGCKHGQRVFRQAKDGSWSALMCSLPQSRKADQCSPEWGNKKKFA